jgi:hypothetical protein
MLRQRKLCLAAAAAGLHWVLHTRMSCGLQLAAAGPAAVVML